MTWSLKLESGVETWSLESTFAVHTGCLEFILGVCTWTWSLKSALGCSDLESGLGSPVLGGWSLHFGVQTWSLEYRLQVGVWILHLGVSIWSLEFRLGVWT